MSRVSIPKRLQLTVFYRDCWHCRYCMQPVFFNPALKLLNNLSPGHSYYHPNGKAGESLELFQWRFASADHFNPVALGGENTEHNLVTSCFRCNLEKRDGDPGNYALKGVSSEVEHLNWDGFASIYLKLPGADPVWAKLIESFIR